MPAILNHVFLKILDKIAVSLAMFYLSIIAWIKLHFNDVPTYINCKVNNCTNAYLLLIYKSSKCMWFACEDFNSIAPHSQTEIHFNTFHIK